MLFIIYLSYMYSLQKYALNSLVTFLNWFDRQISKLIKTILS